MWHTENLIPSIIFSQISLKIAIKIKIYENYHQNEDLWENKDVPYFSVLVEYQSLEIIILKSKNLNICQFLEISYSSRQVKDNGLGSNRKIIT